MRDVDESRISSDNFGMMRVVTLTTYLVGVAGTVALTGAARQFPQSSLCPPLVIIRILTSQLVRHTR